MKALFDTSVIVAASLSQHPQHTLCFPKLELAKQGQIQGYLSTHSLAETYSVLTRLPIQPRLTPSDAERVIRDFLQYLQEVFARWARLSIGDRLNGSDQYSWRRHF
ncbi:type II toxin-antitoxin system VapC family toxin [Phormidium pseudopriestleyi]|uniref:type II toxin-antitoxin system VapC family toxin n=1 Tax=Phormidium pseudopriestleyi TaxID=1759527 RepID=UPI001F5DB544|nr:PIN domain-containing protein [Phormidium pseudopriestleyi]